MDGCGDDDGGAGAHLLTNPSNPSSSIASSDLSTSASVGAASISISSMNSQFEALASFDILRLIFEMLPVSDLARVTCVCRFWRYVASDGNIVANAFMAPWKLKALVGKPLHGSFWRDSSISKFAISHRIRRGDTVASLAIKYSVQVMDIKRLNNMMSDYGINSRERLLIPVSKPEILVDVTCFIELDTHAKREVAVLYLEGGPDTKLSHVFNRTSDRGRKRVIDSIKRSMQVDDGTALYYLSLSNGDPRAALAEFSADLSWERQVGIA
ncbi:F-box protein [Tripterygium wilfordii]|uniref:F-box protein n=1 Tax=Tripterygium wilfordii TaxID=458696 RepID=A0A7J7D1E9_TRIWF|nr:F-box protein At1g55000 [Tripterygium wilfordii]KAF5740059.1 F-box protein [Tripterygium wilfordii]